MAENESTRKKELEESKRLRHRTIRPRSYPLFQNPQKT